MSNIEHPIERAAKHLKLSQESLGAILKVSKGAVSQWKLPGRQTPIEHCVVIEKLTDGAVTRRDLRPDDWHRIWPELIDDDHPAPVAEVGAGQTATEKAAALGQAA